MSAVADVLRRAAELIEPEGAWCQHHGSYEHPDGRVALCALVAISRAASGYGYPVRVSARKALRAQIGRFYIVEWNDDHQRQHAEVVAALRAAAERAE